MPDDALNENTVLDVALRYKEFNRFYKENRSKIPYELLWFKDIDPNDRIEAYCDADKHEIHIKNIPKSKTDAFWIAHELLHLIRSEKNPPLPLLHPGMEYFGLAISLTSLIEDPIVDYILKTQYDFNLRSFYAKGIENGKGNVGKDWKDDIRRLEKGFVHANWILKWRLVDDKNALRGWRKFSARFENECPKSYKIGIETVAIIDDIGVDTIEKQVIIVNKLIDKYKLQGILSIDICD